MIKISIIQKIISSLLLISIILLCVGCESKKSESFIGADISQMDSEYFASYKTIIEKICEAEKTLSFDGTYYPQEFFRLPDDKAYYALYDVDNNGVPELFIGTITNNDYEAIYNIWALKNNKPISLFSGFGQRDRGWLLKDGIILNEGSGGASIHAYDFYKMSPNGYSVELENGFVREYVYGTDTPIITQTNVNGSQEINVDEFERIMQSYTGITASPFDYEQLDTVELEWKAVSEVCE